MATQDAPVVPVGEDTDCGDVAVQRRWRRALHLSSVTAQIDSFLANSGFDRGPWLAVVFAVGIALWFVLDTPWQWCAAIGVSTLVAVAAASLIPADGRTPELRKALVVLGILLAAGILLVWARSAIVGAEPLPYPQVHQIDARILQREEQPAQERVRLVLAMRDAESGVSRKIQVNVPVANDDNGLREGAIIRLRTRLMPPAPPMLPGGYDFARTAWFQGLSATGSVLGDIEIVEPASTSAGLAPLQRRLATHVRGQLGGSPGTIAAAFASGDRGGISEADEEAMRDAGLTHLLSISGLHVSAVIAAAYFLALKLLALWPRIALRVRLPLVAAAIGALAGIGYTLLTGAEVPTVRSCVGAVLVLTALALGREALSMRMVAAAAFFVLLLWPESLVGPSFQMSFAAVLSIVALHNAAPVKAFLAVREESWLARMSRRALMLLVTGLVIEIALMPIVLFHFHRAGVYGAFANVIAIPLVTFVSMPLIALALALDMVGLGSPAWWLAGKSLELLLGIAHWTSAQPGAVKLTPEMGAGLFAIYVAGGLWMALWRGRVRLLGLVPWAVATILLLVKPVPDVLVSGDGRHVGIAGEGDTLLVLRESRSDYAKDNLLELAGVEGEPIALADWPGAQCSRDFCVIDLERGGRSWSLLMSRSRDIVEERVLAAACERSDIVIADRYLPRSCSPRWLKADRRLLDRTGGLAIDLSNAHYTTVAEGQGEHGWWRGKRD
ncbi:MAG: ComEC/Rec2 family competence protein [Sphingomonadaceae bacterium]|nr:ComEC/Rec2 family competence protein [Sphingomonadaceae bacterium]MCP5383933.1 ComEC/Rec2 family competence protein [Altererythrobacter sp.]MCP5390784.1 ComEC/Rec2 family competence protein [Sphingomonadaceae bacterium]MCP5394180.1 ComEC/Rec2 family competence protein [Sphingomonadaceae bacterium]